MDERAAIGGAKGGFTVEVRDGRVAIVQAECPNQVCVRTGWRSDAGDAIVCVPNRAMVRITGDSPVPAVRETVAMDTFVSLAIHDRGWDEERLSEALGAAAAEIRRIEEFASDYIDTSEVGRVNAAAGRAPVSVSAELIGLVQTSCQYGSATGGAFDITVGPVVRCWDFLSPTPSVPQAARLRAALDLVDYRKIVLSPGSIFLPDAGMALDLGGIGKGYAADRAVDVLRSKGAKRCVVDMGGNLSVYWEGTMLLDSTGTMIEVRHPRREGESFGSFALGSGGVSTSGDYQRAFSIDGRRYHHIIDPATGYPADSVVSVTIVAPDAETADLLSTAVFVMGRQRGMAFVASRPDIDALILYEEEGQLRYEATPRLGSRLEIGHDHRLQRELPVPGR
jgi:thiamine biosynthesis lipoprotein